MAYFEQRVRKIDAGLSIVYLHAVGAAEPDRLVRMGAKEFHTQDERDEFIERNFPNRYLDASGIPGWYSLPDGGTLHVIELLVEWDFAV